MVDAIGGISFILDVERRCAARGRSIGRIPGVLAKIISVIGIISVTGSNNTSSIGGINEVNDRDTNDLDSRTKD